MSFRRLTFPGLGIDRVRSDGQFINKMKHEIAISSALAAALLLSLVGCQKRAVPPSGAAPVPSVGPRDQQQVKDELVASMRADLERMRADKESKSPEIYRFAQALDQLMRENASSVPDRGYGAWNAEIQSIGSQKSANLAAEYLALQQAAVAEVMKDQDRIVEETVKRLADGLFAARSSAEVDALLLEISSFQNNLKMESGNQSASGQLLLFRQFTSTWQEFLKHRESEDKSNAVQCLERLTSYAPTVRWLDPVMVSNALQNASRSIGVPSKEQLDEQIHSLVDRTMSATKSTDLDPLLVETKNLKLFHNQLPDRGSSRVRVVENFIENVQVLYFAREMKDAAKFRENLARVENQETGDLGVPRSRYLVYVHGLKQSVSTTGAPPLNPAASPAAAAARMTTLDAIKPNLTALRLAVDADPSVPFASSWRMDLMILDSIARRSEQLKQGRGLQRPVHENGLHTTSDPSIRELQRQFDMLCLNVTFSEETRLLPGEKETAKDFTTRIKKRLTELQKWDSLQTLCTAVRALKITEPVLNADDDAMVSGYLYALRLEQDAKDLRMATCAYQTALASSSKLVPASLIGLRLDEIRRKDPKAYQQGSALALNISKAEGKRAPGERAEALQWVIPARKPWSGR
jgi:hypothetical protein